MGEMFVCTARPSRAELVRPRPVVRPPAPIDLARTLGAVGRTGAGLRLTAGAVPMVRPAPLRSAPVRSAPVPIMDVEPPQPPVVIRLWVIFATDDDGLVDGAPPPTLDALKAMFAATYAGMRQDWAGTGIDFLFLPDCDLEIRHDSRLRQKYHITPAQQAGVGGLTTQDQVNALLATTINHPHRNAVAAERPNRLMINLYIHNDIAFDAGAKQGVYQPNLAGSMSWGDLDFVLLNCNDFVSADHAKLTHDASRAGHEIGHFLHLWHTHRDDAPVAEPAHADAATTAQRLAAWRTSLAGVIDALVPAHSSAAAALAAYDALADLNSGVADTPADPGAGIIGLANAGLDASGPVGTLSVPATHVAGGVVFAPDRENPMSYYLDAKTDEPMRFTAGQIAVMRSALIDGNRRRLVAAQLGDTAEPALRTAAMWSPSTAGQYLSLGAPLDLHRQRHHDWTAKGFHLAWQSAYARNGQVLYDAAWDEGARDQEILYGYAAADVYAKVATNKTAGRRVGHIDAYRHPGADLLYNVVFDPGGQEQTVVLDRSAVQIDDAWTTQMPHDRRFRCLASAVDNAGSLRFAAVLQPGTQSQHYNRDVPLDVFAADYDMQWGEGRKLVALTLAAGPQGLRYSGLWDPDAANQFVMWLHVRERILEVYDEMWCQGFRLRGLVTVAV